MAKVLTPPQLPDLSKVGLDEVDGLHREDREELRLLKIRNLAQLVAALEANGWNIAVLNTEDVFFSVAQSERIAASVARRNDTPDRPEILKVEEEPDLTLVSIRSLGLPEEEVREWRYHNIGSLAAAYAAMTWHAGDLTALSDGVVVIEKEQSDNFGDLLLAHPLCPQDIKERFLPSKPLKVEVSAPKPTPAPKAPVVKTQQTIPAHLKVEVPPAPKPVAPRPQAQQQPVTPPAPKQETVAHAALAGALQVLSFGRIKL